jgi:hypothetical protein
MREASFWEARSFWVSPVIGLSPSGMGMEKRSPERARFSKSFLAFALPSTILSLVTSYRCHACSALCSFV